MQRSDRRYALAVSLIVLAAAAGLYAWAWASAGDGQVFGGLLFNPIDGNTYLAKAYQGYEGSWRFRLPYTAEPGDGAFINLYYILIGHKARWTGLPIPLVYNLARLAGTGLMLAALWSFFRTVLGEPRRYRAAFAISALTLGMGWLLLPTGAVPMDFWVAEAYPFLAALTNPHFPLALGLIAVLANPVSPFHGSARFLRDAALALLLALVSPFAVAVALLPWAGEAIAWLFAEIRARSLSFAGAFRKTEALRILAILAGGLPVVVYDLVAIRSDPVLAAWDAQNVASLPPWWNLMLSFSPALILALIGFRKSPNSLRGWLVLGAVLVLVPFGLQRRFLMGLHIPLAGMAAVGLEGLRRPAVRMLALAAFLPSPLLLVLTAGAGIANQSPLLYLQPGEREAFAWIEENTHPDALVLAGPETGLFLPAYTGRRVIYGHPFETIDAAVEKEAVEAYFADPGDPGAARFLSDRGVDYVFYGPREAALGPVLTLPFLLPVYAERDVRIFSTGP